MKSDIQNKNVNEDHTNKLWTFLNDIAQQL